MKRVGNEFKSNCLWEAIKAKLKNWKDVKIIKLGKDINSNGTHYMWVNKAENKVYHFRGLEDICFPFFEARFKGVIQEDNLDVFNQFLYSCALQQKSSKLRKTLKKYNLEDTAELLGSHYPEDNEFPSIEEARRVRATNDMVQVVRKVDNEVRISFIKADEKLPEDTYYWLYVTRESDNLYGVIKYAK